MLIDLKSSTLLLVDVQEKLVPIIAENEALIRHCEWLLKLANELNVKIVVTEQYPQGLGHTISRLHPQLANATIVTKRSFSCLAENICAEKIKPHLSKQIVLIGIESHVCVLQSAIDLQALGHQVFVVADAVSSSNLFDKKMALKRLRQQGIEVVTQQMVFFEWLRTAENPEFKRLAKQFL